MYTRWLSAFSIFLLVFLSACGQQKSAEEYIQNGKDYFDKKEWKSAIIEFKNAVKLAPKNPQARELLGKSYLETFSIHAAIKELSRARDLGIDAEEIVVELGKAYAVGREHQTIIDEITLASDFPNTLKANILSLRAIAYLGLKKRETALEALNQAMQLDENSPDVRLAWALFEKENQDTDAQISWLEPLLLESDGGNADAWSMMGEIEYSRQNLEAAEKAYNRSIELRPYVHFDMARRALVRLGQKKLDEAQADINTLKKEGANWPMVGHIDGVLALQNQETEEAKAIFQSVLSKAPDYPPTQYMLSLIYFSDRNFQNAASLLERYTESNPGQLQAGILYANTLLQLNQIEKAQDLLNEFRTKFPEDSRVLAMLGSIYLRQGQTDKAIEILQMAVAIDPKRAQSRLQLGTSLLGREATLYEGQQELIKAIELDPELLKAEVTLFKSYLVEKKFSEAREVAKSLDEKNKDSSQGANFIALTFFAEDKPEKAKMYLQDTLKRFPADFVTSHNLARIHLRNDNLADAKLLYENVLEKTPSHLQTLNQLALIAAREGDQDQVMVLLKRAQENNPDELAPRIALASQYLKQGKANQATQILADVSEAQKSLPGYVLLMAQAKLGVKENQHAIRILKLLIAKNPNIPAAHFLLAQGYAQQNDSKQLRASLDNTLSLAADHLAANIILAKLDLAERKFDDFRERVAYLDKTHPDNVDVKFLKAKVVSGDQDFNAAISTLTSLMEQSPHSNVVIDLSKNQWNSGDKQAAISGLELWVQDHADDTRALIALAQFYLSDGQTDDARLTYEKVISIQPDNPLVLNNLAWLLKESNPEQGIKYAERALELNPDNAYTQDTLAMLYLETENYTKALELSEQAAKVLPKVADIQLNYAKVLVANSQKERAREVLMAILNITQSEAKKLRIRNEIDKLQ